MVSHYANYVTSNIKPIGESSTTDLTLKESTSSNLNPPYGKYCDIAQPYKPKCNN